MRIALVTAYLEETGGPRTHVRALRTGLAKAGIETVVVATGRGKPTGWDTDDPDLLWMAPKLIADHERAVETLFWFLRPRGVDLIHGHAATLGQEINVKLAYSLECPSVLTMHGFPMGTISGRCFGCLEANVRAMCPDCVLRASDPLRFLGRFLRFRRQGLILAAATRVLVLNDISYQLLRSVYHLPADRLGKVRLWVDVPPDDVLPVWRRQARERWHTPPDRTVILWAGRPFTHKRLDVALAAFATLSRTNDQAELWLAGPFAHYPTVDLSLPAGTPAVVGERVRYLGDLTLEDMHLTLAGADVVWQPSVWESVSLIMLEAMAFRVPVVTVASDNAELLRDGCNARVVPRDDVRAFVQVTEELIANPQAAKSLTASARAYVQKCHNEEQCVADSIGQYHTALRAFET